MDPYALPDWGIKALRKYLKSQGIHGKIEVSNYNGKPVDSGKNGKGVYCLIITIKPTTSTFEVYEDGKVGDLGCDYKGRWDGMG